MTYLDTDTPLSRYGHPGLRCRESSVVPCEAHSSPMRPKAPMPSGSSHVGCSLRRSRRFSGNLSRPRGCLHPCIQLGGHSVWVWVKMKPAGDNWFSSLGSFARVPFWVSLFYLQLYLDLVGGKQATCEILFHLVRTPGKR